MDRLQSLTVDAGRRRADLIGLIAAEAISNIGGKMTFLAIPWLVLVTTGDAVKVGLVAGAEALTYVVSGVLAAPLQDRIGARVTSLVSDVVSVAVMTAIALLGQLHFGGLLVLVGVLGVLRAQGDRAKVTMLAPLMESATGDFARISAMRESVLRSSTLLGSSLAGITIVAFGPLGALWIDAATFAVAAVLTVALASSKVAVAPDAAKESYFAAMRGGFTWYRQNRLIRAVTGMLFFTNLFNQASAAVFVPLWVFTHMDDPTALGAVATAYAVGLIGGSVVFAWLSPILPRYPVLVAGYFIGGAPRFLVLALSDSLPLVVAVTLVSGFAMCSVNPTVGAMIYKRTPKEMMSRVTGIITVVAFGGLPLGGLLGGLLVQTWGLTDGILIATAMYFAVTLTPVIGYHLWRELNDAGPKRRPVHWLTALAGPRLTLRYDGGDWTVAARHRWRRIASRQPIESKLVVTALTELAVEPVSQAVNEVMQHDIRRFQQRHAALAREAGGHDVWP